MSVEPGERPWRSRATGFRGVVHVRSRSMAEMGLSARTQEGHCSNAGGLSAVLRDSLYTLRRIRVVAGEVVCVCETDLECNGFCREGGPIGYAVRDFPEPCQFLIARRAIAPSTSSKPIGRVILHIRPTMSEGRVSTDEAHHFQEPDHAQVRRDQTAVEVHGRRHNTCPANGSMVPYPKGSLGDALGSVRPRGKRSC